MAAAAAASSVFPPSLSPAGCSSTFYLGVSFEQKKKRRRVVEGKPTLLSLSLSLALAGVSSESHGVLELVLELRISGCTTAFSGQQIRTSKKTIFGFLSEHIQIFILISEITFFISFVTSEAS